jgi:hypothetical protein
MKRIELNYKGKATIVFYERSDTCGDEIELSVHFMNEEPFVFWFNPELPHQIEAVLAYQISEAFMFEEGDLVPLFNPGSM